MDAVERQLAPVWAPELVALSYLISWLGAYTSTQVMIHARYTRSAVLKWLWTFFASIAFGFCAIWSMHFVGMLACRLDVRIEFDLGLTVLSAAVAVLFTFLALATPYATDAIEHSKPVKAVSRWNRELFAAVTGWCHRRDGGDIEAGYQPLRTGDSEDGHSVAGSDHPDESRVDDGGRDRDSDDEEHHRSLADNPYAEPHDPEAGEDHYRRHSFSEADSHPRRVVRPPTPPPPSSNGLLKRLFASTSERRRVQSPDFSDSPSSSSSDSRTSLTRQSSESTLTPSSTSWSEPLHAGLSREARLRIKARAREKPVPHFGWKYWLKAHYKTINTFVFIRAAIWGLAIVFMHYCGMWAMKIPLGRIVWDMRLVLLSYVVAFSVCLVGCIFMVRMETHFGRQVIFSTTASFGVSAMHYTGMRAATFYTYAPPSESAGYPQYLSVTITAVAVFVCMVSNAMLANSAIMARNRMAEMILTKRRLWRIMAEKEAAEQAIELKQQFISVASHEIRTPLHTVNGYCELLSRTRLTEEQSLYVTSIQQACHAINVIAGNVLDFSKLDRNNVELSARPVHMEVRKMIEDIAKITEARGIQPGQPGVDVIIYVAKDVPHAVYLDETYAFRILMNLLSNAQKFCDQGYISLSVTMATPTELVIEVSDTGCGIPKSFRGALFEPFRQADTSLTRPRQGTGLGLSIVKHLVQRMSGSVDVDSTENEGSTFIVRLPVTLPSRSPTPTGATMTPLPTKRIKVIYRHNRTQGAFVTYWTQYGYSVSSLSASQASALSPDALARGADIIWTDAETVASSPALRTLMSSGSPTSSGSAWPVVFVAHADTHDLEPLEPQLSDADNVVLVKRPVIMHSILHWIESPEAHLRRRAQGANGAAHAPGKVRFALPVDVHASASGSGANGGDIPLSPLKTTPTEETPSVQPVRLRVLVVEDNLVNQRLACRLLDKLGYDAVTANHGQHAVDVVSKEQFSCCLMDCQMPVLDGFAATRKIRDMEKSGQLRGRLPIIALSANVTQESESECRESGMDDFLPKPMKLTDMNAALSRWCRSPLASPSETSPH